MSPPPSVQVQRLSKRYGDIVAVQEIDFEVERGTIFGLLGMNGAGKTTTMEILAGLLRPSSGGALVAGYDLVRQPMEARRSCAVVFESLAAPRPHWKVREYLQFFGELSGVREFNRQFLEILDIEPLMNRRTGELSGGQRRKVELARAFNAQPEVVFLDEPTKELDLKAKRLVWDAIRKYAREDKTIILSSHDVLEVMELCDRVAIMKAGRIVARMERSALVSKGVLEVERMLVEAM